MVAGVVLATLNAPDVPPPPALVPHEHLAPGTGRHRRLRRACPGGVRVGRRGWHCSLRGRTLVSQALPQLALALISFAIFALVPLSLAYTLAQCGFQGDALNAIANLGGMVMSFLGGAWVPLSLMGANVQAVAHFTPTFWMYDAVTCALGAQEVNASVLATVGIDLGIIALFAVAIVSAGLVAARLRVREV